MDKICCTAYLKFLIIVHIIIFCVSNPLYTYDTTYSVNLPDGIWQNVCVLVCVCLSLHCLAHFLAAPRTLPCIRKHAGLGLESRSGLENNVGTLLRPDFLLSLALCCLSPEAPQPGVPHHACPDQPVISCRKTVLLRDGETVGMLLFFFFFEETTWSFGTNIRPASTTH